MMFKKLDKFSREKMGSGPTRAPTKPHLQCHQKVNHREFSTWKRLWQPELQRDRITTEIICLLMNLKDIQVKYRNNAPIYL